MNLPVSCLVCMSLAAAGADETAPASDPAGANVFVQLFGAGELIFHNDIHLSGVQLSGLIGMSISGKVECPINDHVYPFLDGGLGWSGFRVGIGTLYATSKKRWSRFSLTNDNHATDFATAGLGLRGVLIQRWHDDTDRNQDVYGVNRDHGTYYGMEGILVIGGLSIIPGLYHDSQARDVFGAVSFGIGF